MSTVIVDPQDPLLRTFYPMVVVSLSVHFRDVSRLQTESTPAKMDASRADILASEPGKITSASFLDLPNFDELEMPLDQHGAPKGAQLNQLNFTVSAVPLSASVTLPNPRQAGTFDLTLRYEDFPVDPRSVRSISAAISIGSVPPEDYAEVMAGGVGALAAASRRRSIHDVFNDSGEIREDTLAVVGLIDEISVSHGSDGSTVSMSGRDLIGVLIDSPFLGAWVDAVDFGQDIGAVVKSIILFHPLRAFFVGKIDVAPAETWPGGSLPSVAWAQDLGPTRTSMNGRPRMSKGATDLTFWDYITQVCTLVGAIPRIRGSRLQIMPAQGLYDQATAKGTWSKWYGPPFQAPDGSRASRQLPDGTLLVMRQMAYGRDLESLSVSHKLAGTKAKVVEVVSRTESATGGAGRVVVGRWPEQGDLPNYPGELVTLSLNAQYEEVLDPQTGKKKRKKIEDVQDVHRVSFPGISDPNRCKLIAKAIFEEVMRGEFQGTAVTPCLGSAGGSNADPDMIRLRPGDAIIIGVAPEALSEGTLKRIIEDPEGEVARLARRYSPGDGPPNIAATNLAKMLVNQQASLVRQLTDTFYVQNVQFTVDGSKLSITFDFVNFYEVQMDATPASPPTATKRKGGRGGPYEYWKHIENGPAQPYAMGPLSDLPLEQTPITETRIERMRTNVKGPFAPSYNPPPVYTYDTFPNMSPVVGEQGLVPR